jgi:hypothetical protein
VFPEKVISIRVSTERLINPRSPCNASVGWRKVAGTERELNVATSFLAICPDFPTPIITNFPRLWPGRICEARVMVLTAREKASRAAGSRVYSLERAERVAASVDRTCTAAPRRSSTVVGALSLEAEETEEGKVKFVLVASSPLSRLYRETSSRGVQGIEASGVTGDGGDGGGMAGNWAPGPRR